MTLLARMVILPATEDPVRSLNASFDVEHGQMELNDPGRQPEFMVLEIPSHTSGSGA
jgi:hypothetical protein